MLGEKKKIDKWKTAEGVICSLIQMLISKQEISQMPMIVEQKRKQKVKDEGKKKKQRLADGGVGQRYGFRLAA